MTQTADIAMNFDQLEIRAPDGTSRTMPVSGSRLLIGRRPSAEVCIDHETVSRQHAELIRDPFGRWWVRDLGSRNGTKVNGVAAPEQMVAAGDVIRVGKWDLQLRSSALDRTRPKTKTTVLPHPDAADDLEPRVLEEGLAAPSVTAVHLELLLDFSQRLARTPDVEKRRRMLCELLVGDSFHGLAGLIIQCGKEGTEPEVLCGPVQNKENPKAFYISRTLLRAMQKSGKPVLGSNVGNSRPVTELSVDSAMMAVGGIACPLEMKEQGMALYVAVPPEFTTPEWLALAALAGRHWANAESSWHERRLAEFQSAVEQELKQAQKLQQQFMPRAVKVPGFDWSLRWEPCRWVAGDYSHVMGLKDGRIFATVADVCGKGLQAALVAAGLHTLIRTALLAGADLADLMNRADEHLRQFLPPESFVTLAAVTIDPVSGAGQYVNAGHPSPYMISGSGQIEALEGGINMPLGIETDPYVAQAFTLEPDRMLLMYTDGCPDLIGPEGQALGREKLEQMISQIAGASGASGAISPAAFNEKLFAQMQLHCGPCLPADDRTVLTCARV
jgi:serine phosphatase RsbU (regulator of sigma subunit)/pSer/pThr/pTyr-binding forkhead associated (FHA) protein